MSLGGAWRKRCSVHVPPARTFCVRARCRCAHTETRNVGWRVAVVVARHSCKQVPLLLWTTGEPHAGNPPPPKCHPRVRSKGHRGGAREHAVSVAANRRLFSVTIWMNAAPCSADLGRAGGAVIVALVARPEPGHQLRFTRTCSESAVSVEHGRVAMVGQRRYRYREPDRRHRSDRAVAAGA